MKDDEFLHRLFKGSQSKHRKDGTIKPKRRTDARILRHLRPRNSVLESMQPKETEGQTEGGKNVDEKRETTISKGTLEYARVNKDTPGALEGQLEDIE